MTDVLVRRGEETETDTQREGALVTSEAEIVVR